MWKSKRRKYLEALLEGIRDRQHDLIDMQQQQTAQMQNNKAELYSRICSVEENLNYYSMIYKIMTENKYANLELLSLGLQNTDSKKVLICGFFGADNLGDELMLQTLLSLFPKEKLSSVTVMLCDNEAYNYYHLPGVNFIHLPKNKFDCNIMAQTFDTLIWGGGALIDDSDYNTDTLTLNNLFINLSNRFIAFGKKVIALGLSANQNISNTRYVENLKYIAKNSAYFSLRDIYSKSNLENLGVEGIHLLDDLVFFNKLWQTTMPKKTPDDTKVIGIIWVCYDGFEEKLKVIIEAIRKQFKENYKIKFIPFYDCLSTDTVFYQKIVDGLEYKKDIIIAPYCNNLEDAVRQIAETDYIINMRYHSMLISNILNLKSLNICYDTHRHYVNKVRYLTELFGTYSNLQLYSELPLNAEDINLNFTAPDENKIFKLPEPVVLEEIINNAIQ